MEVAEIRGAAWDTWGTGAGEKGRGDLVGVVEAGAEVGEMCVDVIRLCDLGCTIR